MKQLVSSIFIISLCATLTGCSGGGSGSTTSASSSGTPIIASVSDLPRATGPVQTATDAAQSVEKDTADIDGMGLGEITAEHFVDGTSAGACVAFNQVRDVIRTSAFADMVLCFMDHLNDVNSFANVDIYDGAWHIFDLAITEANYFPDRAKMRVLQDDGGSITSFELFLCSNNEESGYVLQNIDGTAFAMKAKGYAIEAGSGGWYDVNVEGTLNATGSYASKRIVSGASGIWNGDKHWNEMVFTHNPGAFALSGFQAGDWDEGTNTGTYADGIYSEGELFDFNDASQGSLYELSLLSVGDGAALYRLSGTFDGTPYAPDPNIVAWDGQTMMPLANLSESPFFENVMGNEPPTPPTTAPAIAFEDDESWDCTDDEATAVSLPPVNGAMVMMTCNTYAMNHQWIDCSQLQ